MLILVFALIGLSIITLYTDKYLYKSIIFLSVMIFTKLVFLVIGIPVTLINLLIEGHTIIIALSVWKKNASLRIPFSFPGLFLFILFTASILLSLLFTDFNQLSKSFSFYRHLLISYLFFLIAYNIKIDKIKLNSFVNTLKILLIIQFFGALIKIFTIGLAEKYVGLVEERAGSLNAIFPLIAISFFASLNYFYKKEKYFWLKLFAMAFIGVVGIKRGFVVFLPLLVLFGIALYYRIIKKKRLVLIRGLVFSPLLAILLVPFIYFAVVFSPLLNRDGKIGGDFDLKYAYDVSVNHNVGDPSKPHAEGRISSLQMAIEHRFSKFSLSNLFGDGPGMFVDVDNESSGIQHYNILTFTVLSGFIRQLISIGIIGSSLVILFYTFFLTKVYKKVNNEYDRLKKSLGVLTLLIGLIFYYDHIFYSPVFYNTHVPNYMFFVLSGLVLNRSTMKNNSI